MGDLTLGADPRRVLGALGACDPRRVCSARGRGFLMGNMVMGVKVNGKYLLLFQSFAEAWDPTDWYTSAMGNPHREQLVAAIAGMHPNLLSSADAEQLVLALVVGEFIERAVPQSVAPAEEPTADQRRARLRASLVSYVESLPRRYHLTVPLPAFPEWWTTADVQLADDVRICGRKQRLHKAMDGASKVVQALVDAQNMAQTPLTPFLRISVSGFGDYASDTPAVSQAVSLAKQMAYLLRVYGVANAWGVSQEEKVLWECESDGRSGLTGMAPPSLARMFSSLSIEESELKIWTTGMTLLGGSSREAATPEEKNQAVDSRLDGVRRALNARDESDYQTVAAAMEWYQDSISADNQTVAFISACIGIEALIGTNEQETMMSDRLADRYAFMTGGNRSERTALRNEFRELLKLRGRLVHGRQPRLKASERERLRRLQEILDQLIRKELDSTLRP